MLRCLCIRGRRYRSTLGQNRSMREGPPENHLMFAQNRSRLGAACIVSLIFSLLPVCACAQTPFNVPAEPLAEALKTLATQAGLNLYYDPSAVAGLKSTALRADLSPKAALARLLLGTRLVAVYVNADTVRVEPRSEGRRAESKSASGDDDSGRGGTGRMHPSPEANDPLHKDHRPIADRSTQLARSTGDQARATALRAVIVTGSRLPTTAKYTAQEVQIYSRAAIDQSGKDSIASFLSTLPAAPVTSATTAFGTAGTVSLRGLPVGTTLVLLDGRRLENSAISDGTFFDLNDIPLAAVKRIEIDPTGASAVYGSDAIGGVVNIILKHHFNGFAADLRYGSAKDIDNEHADLAWGRQWRSGGISVIANYSAESGLSATQRLLTASNDYTSFGGPDNNYPACAPGNVFSLTGAPLPGAPAGSTATYAEASGTPSSGVPTLSQFTYGALNECALTYGLSLLPSRHSAAVVVEGHLKLGRHVKAFTQILYTHVTMNSILGYPSLFGVPGYQQFTVSAQNPYNPFGEAVGVSVLLRSIPNASTVRTDFFRPLVGIKGSIAQRWNWEVSAWQSSDWTREQDAYLLPNNTAIQAALNSSNPATALNPFSAGAVGSLSELSTLFGTEAFKELGRERSVEAYIRGRVAHLPAGPLNAIVGGIYSRDTLYQNLINDGVDPPHTRLDYHRKYSAVFVQARIPIIGRIGALTRHLLSLSVAGRHDHYSDFGSANTYQIGLKIQPIRSLLVRGTYATDFAAPTLPYLYGPQTSQETLVTAPATNAPEIVTLLTGGNPALRAITGTSSTYGVVYLSQEVPGLTVAVTQWSDRENNVIQSLSAQDLLDNAASFPGRVTTNAAGQILELNDTAINFGSINVAGLDYQVTYARPVTSGKLTVAANATETYRYRQALVAGGPALESVSIAQDDGNWAPRWKGTLSVGWRDRRISAVLEGNYTGKYQDYDSQREIGNFWIANANVRWQLGRSFAGTYPYLRGTYIEAGATNLFNRSAQFSNYDNDFYGFDAAEMSVVGRSLYVQAGMNW